MTTGRLADRELRRFEASISKVVKEMSRSFRAEMAALGRKMDAGFDRVEAATRCDTNIPGGASAIAALNRWAARRDTTDRKRDATIHSLETRVCKLERASKKRK